MVKLILFLTWSEKCIIVSGDYDNEADNKQKFKTTDTKL